MTSREIRTLTHTAIFAFLVWLFALGGCGGSRSSGNPAPGAANPGGSGGSVGTPKFVYALNGSALGGAAIAGFHMDPATGVLTTLSGSPFSIGVGGSTSPSAMAATPRTEFVYVADWFNKDILIIRADPGSGALTKTAVIPVPSFQNPVSMRIEPKGRFLFCADVLGMQVQAFAIGSDGNLAAVPGSPFQTSEPTGNLTIDASGHFLFLGGDTTISGFVIGSNGSLTPTPGSPVTVRAPFINPDKGPTGLTAVLDPGARFLYAIDSTAPAVFVYAVASDGTLTAVSGSPFTIDNSGTSADISKDGKFLFVGGFASVSALAVNTQTGAVRAVMGSPFSNETGGTPILSLLVDPSNTFVLTANEEETNVSVFAIDGSTGALTMVPGAPFPTAPQPIGGGSPSVGAITQ